MSNKNPLLKFAIISACMSIPVVAVAGPVVPPPAPPDTISTHVSSNPALPAKGTTTADMGTGPSDGSPLPANATVNINTNLAPTMHTATIPTGLKDAQAALAQGNGGHFKVSSADTQPTMTPQEKEMAQEAAEVWAHDNTPTQDEPEYRSHHSATKISQKVRNARRVNQFENAWQGRVYDIPAGGYYVTIEATAPILHAIIPPSKKVIDGHFSYLARGKFLPDMHDKVLMLRFHRQSAYHPVELTLVFKGGLRTLYLLPKPLPIGKTIHVMAPAYTAPAKPLKRSFSGNPASNYLPAIRAVWEHASTIPGFNLAKPPRHVINYGRLELVPEAGYSAANGGAWMILWKIKSLHHLTSNISPAQFSGPGIEAVSLTGTQVSASESPYMLTVESNTGEAQ